MMTAIALLTSAHAVGAVVRAALPAVILRAAKRDLAGGEERVRRTGITAHGRLRCRAAAPDRCNMAPRLRWSGTAAAKKKPARPRGMRA